MSDHQFSQDDGRRRTAAAIAIGLVFGVVVVVGVLAVPVSVRHAAPFSSVQTVDFDRGIATLGGEVHPNYDDFDRVELDLRAYTSLVPDDRYDFVLTLQTLDDHETVRRVAFSVPADRIPATKSAFTGIGTSVGFDAIPDSAGQTYYLSLERGPRNVDDVVTLWGIRSYSNLRAVDVLVAATEDYDLGLPADVSRAVILALLWLVLVGASVLVATVTLAAWPGDRSWPAVSVGRHER